ncbi:MAG TPA: nucleoside hydrolase [Anaerolineales bacterium]|nr:nucleoside hydrolase [Anaerolineales bacterium]
MTRIVIDTDPGIDDAHAIMLAFSYPGTIVEAITTVAGNVPLERTTANALIILDILGRDVPVFSGCEDALVIPTSRRAISHGKDGLGDSDYPFSKRKTSSEHAVHALIRMANEYPGELTLVALGPLTNVALATRLDPKIPEKYKRLVVLGGAYHAVGNSWTPAAEFNFSTDPESAAIVLDRWPGLTIVPWETAQEYGLTPECTAELEAIDSSRADFFRRIFKNRAQVQFQEQGICYDPDPLAMAVALEPGIVRRVESRYVKVELAGQLTRGQTVVDWFGLTGNSPNATWVLEIDRQRYQELLCLSLECLE